VRDPKGFPDKAIRLPSEASREELVELCRGHTADLLRWIADLRTGHEPDARYDGTVRSLSRLYQRHPESPFHSVKRNTRKSYTDSLKIIENTVGARAVHRVTIVDVRSWYRKWRAPKTKGGPERIDRAHDAVSMFRTILRFGFALGHDECGTLDGRLATQRFEKGGAREEEMTYQQAAAFVRTALDLGQRGVIPEWRGRSMAIGVAAQFELALRQKDIIGEWTKAEWSGPFTWDNVPGWRLRLKTSKNRAAAVFTLTDYPLLFPLLEAVPHEERLGAIVKGERGLPVRERSYRRWFRAIARAAGIRDEVWSMDSRAGAATQADEAGADLKAISDMLTHADTRTTLRYVRRREKGIQLANQARIRSRQGDNTA